MRDEPDIAVCEFVIITDSNESAPYTFREISPLGQKHKGKLLVVPTKTAALWAMAKKEIEIKGQVHEVGLADYSIEGFEEAVQIERKSLSDLFSTLGQRRDRFEAEIKRLNDDCEFAAVVIEAGWDRIASFRDHGPAPKSVIGTMNAWMQRYPRVHWLPYPTRAFAEVMTFRMLERFYRDRTGKGP